MPTVLLAVLTATMGRPTLAGALVKPTTLELAAQEESNVFPRTRGGDVVLSLAPTILLALFTATLGGPTLPGALLNTPAPGLVARGDLARV